MIESLEKKTLAEAAGLSPQMINNIEGWRCWSSEDTLVKIANALKIDVRQPFTLSFKKSEQMHGLYSTISGKTSATLGLSMNELLNSMTKSALDMEQVLSLFIEESEIQ